MAITTTGTSELGQRVLEIAESIAKLAGEATGEQEAALWSAANKWAHVYTLAKYRTRVTVEMVATAMRADECAAEGGYEGPWGAQELVKLAEPRPKPARGPRMAITHLGYIEVPEGFGL